jgi:signal peptidase II
LEPTDSGRTRHLGIVIGVATTVVLVDQVTKSWAVSALQDRVVHVVWTLRLALTQNTGSAFSMATGSGPVIAVVALVVVGILLWTGRSVTTRSGAIALGLIAGGAIGNLADRVFRGAGFLRGGVVDFIDLQWWPVFNVADAAIVVGAILLLVLTWLDSSPRDA